MDKMILKDNTTIELQTGASLSAVTAKFNSKDDMLVAWKTLTPENLAEVKFQNDAGMTVGTYTDLVKTRSYLPASIRQHIRRRSRRTVTGA